MPASSLAVENSGILTAIDAYQDGVGIYTVEQIGSAVIDNSEMNGLVYKYGTEAKATGVNVKEYILSSGSAAEKVLAVELGKFKPITSGNGLNCDDKNASTINDKYTNGTCVGTIVNYSCLNILNNGLSVGDGIYNINLGEGVEENFYCDMTTDGGGWTLTYAHYFNGIEDGPVYLNMKSTSGTYGYNNEFSKNPIAMYSNLNAKDVLFSFDNRWLVLPDVSSSNFDWMWHSGTGFEQRVISNGARTSQNTHYSTVYFGHWATQIYEISTNTTWDSEVIIDLGEDTNHGAAFWDNANGTYKRLGGYQTPANTWLRIMIR